MIIHNLKLLLNVNSYLNKYGFQSPKITLIPNCNWGIIVVIPCFNETKLIETLSSLNSCESTTNSYLVIVVINQSEMVSDEINKQNKKTFREANQWKENHPEFNLEILFEKSLPKKHAGVGLARKIGMDEAVNQFHHYEKDGIIVALDADCLVDKNYLKEIESHFSLNNATPGCSIRYAHPIEGDLYSDEIYKGIIGYELHLRYYNQAMKYCGLPFAFHTVGSSMAVRSSAYQKQGGMNKRKAGEDFYFLHKIIELGDFSELNSTCVIPSPRISDRVPFGTGRAIGDWCDSENSMFMTYDFQSFLLLKEMLNELETIYITGTYNSSEPVMESFLLSINFNEKIEEIKQNTTNFVKFKKRFFTFFNAFMVLKSVHYMRDNKFPTKSVLSQSQLLLESVFEINSEAMDELELLNTLRDIEK